ncbi:MAG TPA: antibiotic biosynthesis monooxygenase [Sphingomicrobium sp.]|nr:antibiotic biosynthesis monooxygenase [Sphingomicrobium sp.]
MIAVIFEVEPRPETKDDYLAIASELRPMLDKVAGFISVERFTSLSQPNKILSLSFWDDEQALAQWRNLVEHRQAQRAGREHIFEDYRLRVATVIRDYGMRDREEAPSKK